MFDYYKKRIKKENVPRIYTERYNIFYIVEKKNSSYTMTLNAVTLNISLSINE